MKEILSGYLDQIEKSTFNYLVNDDEEEVKIVTDHKKAILNIFNYMQQEIEETKQVANDLNNDLFHERVEKDKLEQKIEKLKNELDRQMQIGYSFEGKVVDQQKEIEQLKKYEISPAELQLFAGYCLNDLFENSGSMCEEWKSFIKSTRDRMLELQDI